MTDTETTLCAGCGIPVDTPEKNYFGPFLCFQAQPLCKTCVLQRMVEHFTLRHCLERPYKLPHWRPRS